MTPTRSLRTQTCASAARRSFLFLVIAAPLMATLAQAQSKGVTVSVQGFGSSSLLGAEATEDSLVAILIEELIAQGGWIVVDETGGTAGDAQPMILRGVVTKYAAGGAGGLSLGGLGGPLAGRAGVKSETISLSIGLRLLDPKTRQVLGISSGEASTSSRGVTAGAINRGGQTVEAEKLSNPAVEAAVRQAIRQAIVKLLPAAEKAAGA